MFHKIRLEADTLEWLYIPDVEYANYDGLSRKLQLIVPWRPQWEKDTRYPLVVYLPGSAFYRQEMYNSVPEFAKIAERGFVVAALQYRESDLAKFPAQIQDVHNGLTFLKENAARFHIDPENIFLMGHSSGGYNALLGGLTCSLPEFDGGAGHKVRGIIAMSAPSYLSYVVEVTDKDPADYRPEDYRPELDMLGLSRFEEDEALLQRALPDPYIHPQRAIPPVLLIHGALDGDVTPDNSRKLYRRLLEAGKEAVYWEIEDMLHGGAWLWADRTLDIAADFIHSHITNRSAI